MREKLIELQDSGNICPKGITSCLDCPYHKEYAFGIPCDEKAAIADRMIANGVTIQKWIPVSERLPETFGEYIVAVQDWTEAVGNLYTDYADYDPYAKQWKTGLYLGVRDKVTHWMPLPEPPKGDEQ